MIFKQKIHYIKHLTANHILPTWESISNHWSGIVAWQLLDHGEPSRSWNLEYYKHKVQLLWWNPAVVSLPWSNATYFFPWITHPFAGTAPIPAVPKYPILPIFFFNMLTLSWITTSGIHKSPEVKCLIVWSKLNHFLVHQPAATNSMHFQSSHHQIYSTSSRIHIWNPIGGLWWTFSV